jgi:hypothetical protein
MKHEEIALIKKEAEVNLTELGHVPATARDLCNLLKLCDEVGRLNRQLADQMSGCCDCPIFKDTYRKMESYEKALQEIMEVVGTSSLQHKIAFEALGEG